MATNKTIYVGIVGSRQRTDKHNVIKLVDSLPQNSVVVSGGCRGVDTWALVRAKQRGLHTIVCKPDLTNAKENYEIAKKFYERNKKIVQHSNIIIAFVAPNRKGGTENTIKWAKKMGKRVIIK